MNPAATEKNWQGIVALVLTLIGAGPIGLVFGILGMKSTKAGRANNGGMALAGVVLGAIGTVAIAALVVLGLTTNALAPSITLAEVRVGDCVAHYGGERTGETMELMTVKKLNCAKPHYGEVYYQGTLTGGLPSESELLAEVEDFCMAQVPNIPPDDYLFIEYFFPTPESWAAGDHKYSCLVVSDGPPLVGHLTDGL